MFAPSPKKLNSSIVRNKSVFKTEKPKEFNFLSTNEKVNLTLMKINSLEHIIHNRSKGIFLNNEKTENIKEKISKIKFSEKPKKRKSFLEPYDDKFLKIFDNQDKILKSLKQGVGSLVESSSENIKINEKSKDSIAELVDNSEKSLKIEEESLEEQKEAEYEAEHQRKFSLKKAGSYIKEKGTSLVQAVKSAPENAGSIISWLAKAFASGYLLKKFWPMIKKYLGPLIDEHMPSLQDIADFGNEYWKEILMGGALLSFLKSPLKFMAAPFKLALSAGGFLFKSISKMGGGLISKLLGAGGFLANSLYKGAATLLGPILGPNSMIGKTVTGMASTMSSVVTKMKDKAKAAMSSIGGFAKKVGNKINPFSTVDATGVNSKAPTKLGALGKFAGKGLKGALKAMKFVARAVPFLGFVIMAYDIIDTFFPNFWEQAKEMFSIENIVAMGSKIKTMFVEGFDALGTWFSEKFTLENIAGLLGEAWGTITNIGSTINTWISDNLGLNISDIIGKATDFVKTSFAPDRIWGLVKSTFGIFTDALVGIGNFIGDLLGLGDVGNLVAGGLSSMLDGMTSIGSLIAEKFSVENITTTAASIVNSVTDGIASIGDWISDKFAKVGKYLEEKIRSIGFVGDTLADAMFGTKEEQAEEAEKLKKKSPAALKAEEEKKAAIYAEDVRKDKAETEAKKKAKLKQNETLKENYSKGIAFQIKMMSILETKYKNGEISKEVFDKKLISTNNTIKSFYSKQEEMRKAEEVEIKKSKKVESIQPEPANQPTVSKKIEKVVPKKKETKKAKEAVIPEKIKEVAKKSIPIVLSKSANEHDKDDSSKLSKMQMETIRQAVENNADFSNKNVWSDEDREFAKSLIKETKVSKKQPIIIKKETGFAKATRNKYTSVKNSFNTGYNTIKKKSFNITKVVAMNPNEKEEKKDPNILRSNVSNKTGLSTSNRDRLMGALGMRESTNNYYAVNDLGYSGKYQFGAPALVDTGLVKRGTKKNWDLDKDSVWKIPGGKQAFLGNPDLQEKTMAKMLNINARYLGGAIGQTEPKKAGMLAASHLLGAGQAKHHKGGDANGTTFNEYFNLGQHAVDGNSTQTAYSTPSSGGAPQAGLGTKMGNMVKSAYGSVGTAVSNFTGGGTSNSANIGSISPSSASSLFSSVTAKTPTSILDSAKQDMGIREKKGSDNNETVSNYHKNTGGYASDEVPWCSSFVNYHVKKAGYKGTNSKAASSWCKWGEPISYPKVGCVAVKKRKGGNHVGIVASVDDTNKTLGLLGGNQGARGEVKVSNYQIGVFTDFRVPGPKEGAGGEGVTVSSGTPQTVMGGEGTTSTPLTGNFMQDLRSIANDIDKESFSAFKGFAMDNNLVDKEGNLSFASLGMQGKNEAKRNRGVMGNINDYMGDFSNKIKGATSNLSSTFGANQSSSNVVNSSSVKDTAIGIGNSLKSGFDSIVSSFTGNGSSNNATSTSNNPIAKTTTSPSGASSPKSGTASNFMDDLRGIANDIDKETFGSVRTFAMDNNLVDKEGNLSFASLGMQGKNEAKRNKSMGENLSDMFSGSGSGANKGALSQLFGSSKEMLSPVFNKFKGNQEIRKVNHNAKFTKEVEVSNKRQQQVDINYDTKKLAKMSATVNTKEQEQSTSNQVTNIMAGQNASQKITLDNSDYEDFLLNQLGTYF